MPGKIAAFFPSSRRKPSVAQGTQDQGGRNRWLGLPRARAGSPFDVTILRQQDHDQQIDGSRLVSEPVDQEPAQKASWRPTEAEPQARTWPKSSR